MTVAVSRRFPATHLMSHYPNLRLPPQPGYDERMTRRFQFGLRWLKCALLTYWAVLLVINIALFCTLGGVASAGRVEGGRFYVGNHGDYEEVSESSYRCSQILGYISFASVPLFFAGVYILGREERKNALLQNRQ